MIKEAYEVLSNPEKKRAFDEYIFNIKSDEAFSRSTSENPNPKNPYT